MSSFQLWAPLSVSSTSSHDISQQVALDHLDLFLRSAAEGFGLSDQNILASLTRLQTGLSQELHKDSSKATEESLHLEEEVAESQLPENQSAEAAKKRKRESKKLKRAIEEEQDVDPANETVADVTAFTDADSPKKKKKKSKKAKEAEAMVYNAV